MQKYWVTVGDSGTTRWYNDAKMSILHRTDGPAIEWADGDKSWWLNGLRHRQHGPAVEYLNGTKEWWLNGNIHRTDGPAIEYADGSKNWYLNGQRHRTDGPAMEWADGSKEWYLDGEYLTEQEHAHRVNPAQEMTVADIEKALGYRVKIVK